MKNYFRRLKDKIVIRLFWSKAFEDVRVANYNMGHEQGMYDQKMDVTYYFNDLDREHFNQMEGIINED